MKKSTSTETARVQQMLGQIDVDLLQQKLRNRQLVLDNDLTIEENVGILVDYMDDMSDYNLDFIENMVVKCESDKDTFSDKQIEYLTELVYKYHINREG